MTHLIFKCLVACLAPFTLLFWGCSSNNDIEEKPNILFILVDDLGYSDVGYMNNKAGIKTANIDRLKAEGMVFTSAYTTCPVCSPTRASIFTGSYPTTVGITNHIPAIGFRNYFERVNKGRKLADAEYSDHLPPESLSLGDLIRDKGYKTAFIGKWHLGGEGSMYTPDGVVNALWHPENYGFDVNIAGCSFGQPASYFAPYKNATIKEGPDGEYLTNRLGDEVVGFLRENKEAPFFVFWAPYTVHTPYQVPQEVTDSYGGDKYLAMIHMLDKNVGKVLDTLKELDIEKNTFVVFYSDNGGFHDNPPLRSSKGSLLEGGIRVPLIIKWPGRVEAGSSCHEVFTSVDMLPTLAELTGYKHEDIQGAEGVSILSLLTGKTEKLEERPVFWHFPHNRVREFDMGAAVRMGKWKLIWLFENDDLFLFDLEKDISETENLAAVFPGKTDELLEILKDWQVASGAKMPARNTF